jgi:hypothetical protein
MIMPVGHRVVRDGIGYSTTLKPELKAKIAAGIQELNPKKTINYVLKGRKFVQVGKKK